MHYTLLQHPTIDNYNNPVNIICQQSCTLGLHKHMTVEIFTVERRQSLLCSKNGHCCIVVRDFNLLTGVTAGGDGKLSYR